ncbi:ABC transporter ATP-binding protein [Candidatus Woesearchaeota archaeon]|jgi:ABC-type branched-subunit amino acid transport system ATPase component|nr:ABC transporter ATP-binding protein [Candidatus Woesearchaeota archaeon]MBT3537388.1 ABC transporter ATP-binding protein [Candidatus Woesearchaeota archaeon]MBT4697087.1 ABC transporter ATP-binding protein [Candidatus Woesearchaeota archaeon]MBT4717594.1 ABC transporter ATP-binding protein [Candidatus Woesearchaeota archaeon]MBT7106302.1 ABC transporter ATP-binding protein [Candidatus Woesearchaeota archaeon]
MLKVTDLHKEFGGIKAVHDCDFHVKKGEIVGLIGPNGAGKTTVFNLVTGFIRPDRGTVIFDGADVTSLKPHIIARMGMSRTFQMIRLFPNMTVLENMLLAMKNQDEGFKAAIFRNPLMRKKVKQGLVRAIEMLEFVDLHAKKNELAKNLSYGQQKLLEIARALVNDPELLLLDEPAAGVNLTMLKKIKGLINKLKDQGKTILLVEHNMEFVMEMCDTVVVLDHGEEIAIGTPKQIQKNKKVLEAYLGGTEGCE